MRWNAHEDFQSWNMSRGSTQKSLPCNRELIWSCALECSGMIRNALLTGTFWAQPRTASTGSSLKRDSKSAGSRQAKDIEDHALAKYQVRYISTYLKELGDRLLQGPSGPRI